MADFWHSQGEVPVSSPQEFNPRLSLCFSALSLGPGFVAMALSFAGVSKILTASADRPKDLHAVARLNRIRAHRLGVAFPGRFGGVADLFFGHGTARGE